MARNERLILAVLVLWGVIGRGTAPAEARSAGTPPISTGSAGGPPRGPRANALPDSVLATIGIDRTVTVSEYLAERQRSTPSTSPDTLTPQEARRFLDRMVDGELLAAAALSEPHAWTSEDSAGFDLVWDRLTMAAALDSALAAWRDARPTPRDSSEVPERGARLAEIGPLLRERSVQQLRVDFDEALLARLAAAWKKLPRPTSDSSLAAQLRMLAAQPPITDVDTLAVIARSSLGPYRVSDLLEAWRRLSPAYRPRVESESEIRALIENGLFERLLRHEAERQHLEQRGDIAVALERQQELIALRHYLERQVFSPLRRDSLGPRRYFETHQAEWRVPMRARLLRLVFDEQAAATRMALQLRDTVDAESLESRSRRLGLDWVVEVTSTSDSALFADALDAGTGAVIGPARTAGAWRVVRVLALEPGRPARYEEVRRRVEELWTVEEARRRLERLCARLRTATLVTVNERGLRRLGSFVSGR